MPLVVSAVLTPATANDDTATCIRALQTSMSFRLWTIPQAGNGKMPGTKNCANFVNVLYTCVCHQGNKYSISLIHYQGQIAMHMCCQHQTSSAARFQLITPVTSLMPLQICLDAQHMQQCQYTVTTQTIRATIVARQAYGSLLSVFGSKVMRE